MARHWSASLSISWTPSPLKMVVAGSDASLSASTITCRCFSAADVPLTSATMVCSSSLVSRASSIYVWSAVASYMPRAMVPGKMPAALTGFVLRGNALLINVVNSFHSNVYTRAQLELLSRSVLKQITLYAASSCTMVCFHGRPGARL